MTVCLMATNAAERIKQLREGAGLTPRELAERIGISLPCVHDLESSEAEVLEIIDLRELNTLCTVLHGSAEWIVTGIEATPREAGPTNPRVLRDALLRRLQEFGPSPEDLWKQIGWDAPAFIEDPNVLWSYPIDFLQMLSEVLGCDWREFVAPTRSEKGIRYGFIVEGRAYP